MAHRIPLCIFLALALHFTAYSQRLKTSQTDYVNFVLSSNKIWLLSQTGEIKLIDKRSAPQLIQSDSVLVLAKDRLGDLVIGTSNQQIKRFDSQHHSWFTMATYTGKLTGIVFDSNNNCLAITDRGILDTKANEVFFPDSMLYLNNQIHIRTQWFGTPTYMIDDQDRIWIGFGYGEWGGDLFVFDIPSQKYLLPQLNTYRIELNPVQAFVQGDKTVYMASGLAHFFTFGTIVAFDNLSARVLLESKPVWKPVTKKVSELNGGEYIGPAAYNKRDHCIYFYSQNGIFKGNPARDLSTMANWKLILKPRLQWTGGQRNAVGPAMNVLKMEFSEDGSLHFLTEHDGLGIYSNNTLHFIK